MNPQEVVSQSIYSQEVLSWSIFIGVTALSFYVIYFILIPYLQTRRRLKQRLKLIGGASSGEGGDQNATTLTSLRSSSGDKQLEEMLRQSTSIGKKIYNFLYRSGFFLKVKSYILFFLLLFTIFVSFTHLSIGASPSMSLGMSFIGASIVFYFFLKWREEKWRKKFENQFPIALSIITRTLSAGLSLSRGLYIASEELPSPLKDEFNYMAAQLQIGTTGKQVFSEAAARINSDNFRFFSIAVVVQTEMGGGLLEILLKLTNVIKEKERLLKKVAILSAEAKTTSWIINALPFVLAAALEYITPGYLSFFTSSIAGNIMLVVFIVSTILGILIIRNMTNFEKL